ncbi:uncharacterized protein LOC144907228 [Branchiostoma floridae x Branchiostoma belcheri]
MFQVVIFNRLDAGPWRLNPFNIHIGDSDQVSTNPKCGGDHRIALDQPSISVSCPGMMGRLVVKWRRQSNISVYLCVSETDSPQFLTCSTATYTSLTISWVKPRAPLIGYRVTYTLVSDSPSDVISTDFGPENEKQVLRDVLADREYSVTLVAVGMYEESLSVEVTCATLTPPPEDFKLKDIAETSITVSWKQKPNSLAIGYRMWIGRSDTAESLFTQFVPTDQTDLTFSDLISDTEYVISATSINRHSEGPAVNITVGTMTPPPEDFKLKDIAETSIAVSWKQKSNSIAIGHKMWIGRSDTAESLFTQFVPTDQTDLTFSDLIPDTEYVISATSINRHSEGPAVNITVGTMTPPPEDFKLKDIAETSITVSWKQKPNSLAIGYRMWIGRSDTAESLFTQFVPTGQTDLTFSDLIPATEYVISATSINMYNEGPAVNITVVTKTDSPTALYIEQKTTSNVTISWLPPEAVITAYNITYTGNGRSTSVMEPGDVDSCKLTGLVPGSQYDIDLVAVSRFGRSLAVSISVITDTDPPSRLNVTKSSKTWLFLEWTSPVANILSYDLEISDEFSSTRTFLRLEGHTTSYNVTDLVPETTYVFKMGAFSEFGRSVDIPFSYSTGSISPIEVSTDSTTEVSTSDRMTTTSTTSPLSTESTTAHDNDVYSWDFERTTSKLTQSPSPMALDKDATTTGKWTTTNFMTSPGRSTEPPRISQTSTPDINKYTTSPKRTTEEPAEKLQNLVQDLDQSLPETLGAEDILAAAASINDIIKPADAAESEMSPSVLQTTAGIIEKLATAARGTQGISVENMETVADALVQTASAAIDVLPKQKTQIASDFDNALESDLIDTSATDISPRQQLKVLKEKEKEKEDMQREASQTIVASLDQVADTLLALQPEDVKYQSSFKTENVAVDVARSPSDKDLHIGSGDIVANIPPTNLTNAHDMMDIKMSVFRKNPYSWSKSTGGQNISSSVGFLTIDSKNSGTFTKNKKVKLDMPFVPSHEKQEPASRSSHVTTESPSTAKENTNGTTMTYHAFNVPADNVIPVIRMNWWDVEATFHVYISYGSPPTREKFVEKRVIKEDGYEAWLRGTNFSASFIPNTTDHDRVLYIGVQKLGHTSSTQGRQQQPTVQILSREDYALSMSAVGCSSWNDNKKQWRLEGCDADIALKDGVISCRCPMTDWKVSVGTMTLPLPNSINFINAFKNFLHLSDNSVVFSIVVSEFILYLHIMVLLCVDFHRVWKALRRPFARWMSPITGASGGAKNQSEPLCKVSLVPPDRMVARHVYQLTVTTGSMFGAGTTSRIGFQLFGSEATSPVKMLNPNREIVFHLQ